MSQMYQVRLASSVSRTIQAEDSVSYPLRLTGILPEEDLLELLRQALIRRGFVTPEGGKRNNVDQENPQRLEGRGGACERIVVDLDSMTVTASLDEEAEIATEVDAVGSAYTRRGAAEQARLELEDRRRHAEAQLEHEGRQVQKELTRRLADSEEERQRQLHEVLQEVYAEALKRKAGELGEVMEVSEGTSPDGQYELVIKVAN